MRPLPISGLAALLLSITSLRGAEPVFTAEQVTFYVQQVKPLLKQHCYKCHGADEKKIRGDLNLMSRSAILKGGESGPAVNLDKAAESLLLLAVMNKRPDNGDMMPPNGQLAADKVEILKRWVTEKLPVSPADLGTVVAVEAKSVVTEEAKKFWAYQPVRKPAVPAGAAHPVDSFLKARLDAKGLIANGRAEKSTLVRRVYFDLIGLPPTPQQVEEFIADTAPNAYEKLLDELLASPHYGEKWGRHWLDVVRYAETNGYERDGPKPMAWKYRDYVIRSFNADKPYDLFVREQIAGDEMPWSVDALTATGFYRLGTWDDEPADREQALYDGYDDIVTVVAQGMLGMSLNCNRCHDHKRDPFPHADYYRFLAFFRDIKPFSDTRSVISANNVVDVTTPEKKKLYEQDLEERNKKIAEVKALLKPIEDAVIKTLSPKEQLAVDDGKRAQVLAAAQLHLRLEGAKKKEYLALEKKLRDLERVASPNQELAIGINHCVPQPPPVYVLARGNPHAPKEKELCPPGFPQVLGVPDPVVKPQAKSSGRRSALADWIAAKENPLTARVFVNRLWQHHFGRGLVGSPNDFGKLGELPTHPELLDWLAADFVENGWKIKRMHKLLMMSDAYQRTSAASESNLKADPTNALLWRFPMRRLGAEEVRDSMLAVSGKLKLEQFGASVFPKIPDEVLHGQSVPGLGWLKRKGGGYDPANPDEGNRRTVYVHIKRSLQVPILAMHDQADTDSSCPVRYTTTVPTQALGLINGEFAHETAKALAERLVKEAGSDVPKQISLAIRLTAGRTPKPEEVAKDVAFVQQLTKDHKLDAATALQRYCLLLLNSNEFVYLD